MPFSREYLREQLGTESMLSLLFRSRYKYNTDSQKIDTRRAGDVG